jgi:hypothetical protein
MRPTFSKANGRAVGDAGQPLGDGARSRGLFGSIFVQGEPEVQIPLSPPSSRRCSCFSQEPGEIRARSGGSLSWK